ncbi:MAG: endonuclease/exonuclease/phosphatase family protein [Myxococcota bacterium]
MSRHLPIHQVPQVGAAASFNGDLRVMTYNIAHANGIKDKPWQMRDATYAQQKLRQLAHVLQEAQADVVLLQEVDLYSARTGYINQAHWLAQQARYPYYACSILWEKNYLPYPLLATPAHHLGRMRSGNCVLSRYPIKRHSRVVFDKPRSNPFWYNLGYIDRGAQTVVLQLGGQRLAVVNAHLEAFDQTARQLQANKLATWVTSLPMPWVLGGDLNAPAPEAAQKSGFVDAPDINYSTDRTIELLRLGLPAQHQEALRQLKSAQSPHVSNAFTFPSNQPNRQMDYLFTSRHLHIVDARVVRKSKTASDHLPLFAQLSLPTSLISSAKSLHTCVRKNSEI